MAWRKLLLISFAGFLVVLAAGGCSPGDNKTAPPAGDDLSSGGMLLEYFKSTHPDREVLIIKRADLNNDHTDDLVVIFRGSQEKNSMLVVLDVSGSYQCTNETPAPVSDQVIRLKDIDDKPPLEFIVQGRKDANFGFAIYRVEGTKLEDLFGEGMKDCC
ncbi:MAG: hypothetical protein A4E53_03334 [Pelotomaculum sp. PtaB.Bin104]|nr:MAG: hypothetical protein A4E53_03334 [Pelotomaculum sp. PtaB.Bin104]